MSVRLTDKRELFVSQVLQGVRKTAAARVAGFSHPAVAACTLMADPKIKQALRERRQAALDGDIASLALQTVREIIGGVDEERTDPETGETTTHRVQIAPAPIRWSASKWVLEQTGHQIQGGEGSARKELTDMSADELAEVVNGGMQALGELAQQLQGHHVVDGQPRQLKELNVVQSDFDDGSDLLD